MPATETKNAPAPVPTPETEEEQELTTAEAIAAAVAEDHVRIIMDGTEAKDAAAAASFLESLTDQGIDLAKKASSAVKTLQNRTRDVAEVMVKVRASIILQDGLPDWAGKTETYKAAVGPIITAAMGPGEGRAIVQNRLQKAVVRMLPAVVAAHVVTTEGLDLAEADVERLVSQGPKASEVEDERVSSLISLVNEQYRTADKDRPSNAPRSPFEEKPTRNRTGLSGGEAAGSEAAQSLPSFRAAMRNLTADAWTAELVLILQDAHKVLTSNKPSFGEGGRKVASANLLHVARIAAATGRITAEQSLNKEQREQLAASLSFDPSAK